ncbi:hypothetical protein KGM_209034 [Danaus plexippus plexippus]|uniref:Uncharacterized protein n=1 Tax=Danaus plexippus plexippus TaxID=278856 RepID=A0A212FCU3_DANPL|nr:hypothetical protein KGM_209034 [Danaus plexippus plexippus]
MNVQLTVRDPGTMLVRVSSLPGGEVEGSVLSIIIIVLIGVTRGTWDSERVGVAGLSGVRQQQVRGSLATGLVGSLAVGVQPRSLGIVVVAAGLGLVFGLVTLLAQFFLFAFRGRHLGRVLFPPFGSSVLEPHLEQLFGKILESSSRNLAESQTECAQLGRSARLYTWKRATKPRVCLLKAKYKERVNNADAM